MLFDVLLVFAWAVAEATFWPFMPEAAIVPVATLHPAHSWILIPAAVAGSAVGGVISYTVGRRHEGAVTLLTQLPFVRESMVSQCRQWLLTEGGRGACRQPLSTIPFKVFAVVAGRLKLPIIPFMAMAMLVRGARFAVVCAFGALVGSQFPTFVSRFCWWLLLAWSVGFYGMLVLTLRRWQGWKVGPQTRS
jgi:membrane protein YqaA with SNARE-associated domain